MAESRVAGEAIDIGADRWIAMVVTGPLSLLLLLLLLPLLLPLPLPLPLPLIFTWMPDQPPTMPDPEGGAHGCAPFFDRDRMASRKIPIALGSGAALSGQGLSLVTFFGPAKKVTRRKAERF